jgi:predicted ester cyclase
MSDQEKNNIQAVRHGPGYFNHESQLDPVRSKMRGPQEFMDTVTKIRKAFSDLHYKEQETIASNDKVVSIVTVKANHTGSFFGFIPPTGNKITYQAVHIFTFGDDGKIIELGVVRGTGPQYDQFLQEVKGSGR